MKTLLAFILLISSLSAWAQEAKNGREGKRTCRIVFPERPNDSPKLAYLYDGKDSRQIPLPSMNFSPVIELPAGEITLLMTPDAIKDEENLPPTAPSLKIKEGIKDFYILVSPDPSNSLLPLKMNLVNVADGKFNPGETLWFNLTEDRIIAKLGATRMSITPKDITISKSPLPESGYYIAEFAYQPKAKGNMQKIGEQHWWHDTKSRHLGFIVNSGSKMPKIYYYRDFR